ncbi:hypothetical protein SprV_0501959800 [Sparganum proliferum]
MFGKQSQIEVCFKRPEVIRRRNSGEFGLVHKNIPPKTTEQVSAELGGIVRQIVTSTTFLPTLSTSCTFDLLVYTDKNTDIPDGWGFAASVSHLRREHFTKSGTGEKQSPHGGCFSGNIIASETLGYFMARMLLSLYMIVVDRKEEMAHYTRDCWNVECRTSYGWVECIGRADRSCYDLAEARRGRSQHRPRWQDDVKMTGSGRERSGLQQPKSPSTRTTHGPALTAFPGYYEGGSGRDNAIKATLRGRHCSLTLSPDIDRVIPSGGSLPIQDPCPNALATCDSRSTYPELSTLPAPDGTFPKTDL